MRNDCISLTFSLLCAQVPAFEGDDGFCVFESNAIAYYGNWQRVREWEGLEVKGIGEGKGEPEWTRRGLSGTGLVLA